MINYKTYVSRFCLPDQISSGLKKMVGIASLLFALIAIMSPYFFYFGLSSDIYAYTSILREGLGFDENLAEQSTQEYAYPEKILVAEIITPNPELEEEPEKWISMLYYNFITRLQFADIPYNYIVDDSGKIYDGRKGNSQVIPELVSDEGAVLVGYLGDSEEMSVIAENAISELIGEISAEYGIPRGDTVAVRLNVADRATAAEFGKLEYRVDNGGLRNKLAQIADSTQFSTVSNIALSGSVTNLEYASKLELDQEVPVSFTITNDGEHPWYTGDDTFLLRVASGEDSLFAVNGEWDSFDTVRSFSDGVLFPGDSSVIEFNIKAPFKPGVIKEQFHLEILNGKKVAGSEFELSIDINKGDRALLRVLETETGSLNVRLVPGYSAAIVDVVSEGDVFFLQETQGEWYKIQSGEGKEGWVFGEYAEIIE